MTSREGGLLRELTTTACELAGCGLLVTAAWLAVGVAAGLAVLGVALLVVSWRVSA